jgi:Predicted membrane protein
MKKEATPLISLLKKYFNIHPDKDDEKTILENVESSIDFQGAQLWILIFAIFIASLGLNVNSTAVIIGAMLISPLMGPIIGMGLAVGISDISLLRRSATNFLVATVISVITATIYFAITPLDEAQSELLARTSPSLYDVLIALLGGAAGFIALTTKGKGNVIPGVAIATALMPPLCTAGYGLAVGNLSYFLGAFYLFFINTVFIGLATLVGTRMLKFRQITLPDADSMRKVKRYIIVIVVLTMLPASYMTWLIIRQSIANNNLRKFVRTELAFKGTQILSNTIDENDKMLNILALGKTIPNSAIKQAASKLGEYQLGGYQLNIIQGEQSDSLLRTNKEISNPVMSGEAQNQKTIEQSQQIRQLESSLANYTRYESLAKDLQPEIKTLFPQVAQLSLSNVSEVATDSARQKRYILAVVNSRSRIDPSNRTTLQRWLKSRCKADSLRLIITP